MNFKGDSAGSSFGREMGAFFGWSGFESGVSAFSFQWSVSEADASGFSLGWSGFETGSSASRAGASALFLYMEGFSCN